MHFSTAFDIDIKVQLSVYLCCLFNFKKFGDVYEVLEDAYPVIPALSRQVRELIKFITVLSMNMPNNQIHEYAK